MLDQRKLPCWFCIECMRESNVIPPNTNEFNGCRKRSANVKKAAWDPACNDYTANEDLLTVVQKHFNGLSEDRQAFVAEAIRRYGTDGETVLIENGYLLKETGKALPRKFDKGLMPTGGKKVRRPDYKITEVLPCDLWEAAVLVLLNSYRKESSKTRRHSVISFRRSDAKAQGFTEEALERLADEAGKPMIIWQGTNTYLEYSFHHYLLEGDLGEKLREEELGEILFTLSERIRHGTGRPVSR